MSIPPTGSTLVRSTSEVSEVQNAEVSSVRTRAASGDELEQPGASMLQPSGAQTAASVATRAAEQPMTYNEARAAAMDATNVATSFESVGSGTNKNAYDIDGKWVLLVAKEKLGGEKTDASKALLSEEAQALRDLGNINIVVPDVGEAEVFVVTVNGKERYAMLEEKVKGIEMRGDGTMTTDSDVTKFSKALRADIKQTEGAENRERKYTNALESLQKLRDHFKAGNDIPDWQVTYNKENGLVVTIDPGQEEIAQSGTAKTDLGRVQRVINDLLVDKGVSQGIKLDAEWKKALEDLPKLWETPKPSNENAAKGADDRTG